MGGSTCERTQNGRFRAFWSYFGTAIPALERDAFLAWTRRYLALLVSTGAGQSVHDGATSPCQFSLVLGTKTGGRKMKCTLGFGGLGGITIISFSQCLSSIDY